MQGFAGESVYTVRFPKSQFERAPACLVSAPGVTVDAVSVGLEKGMFWTCDITLSAQSGFSFIASDPTL